MGPKLFLGKKLANICLQANVHCLTNENPKLQVLYSNIAKIPTDLNTRIPKEK